MPSIKINYQPEVFDDCEKCHGGQDCYCHFWDDDHDRCWLFNDHNGENKKSEKCLSLWNQANQSRPPKTLPEGHRLG